jgi:uncharacterized membrane protein
VLSYNENYWRTISKVVSIRIIFTFIHTMNTYLVTGNLLLGLKVAGLAFFVNPVLYWLHERGWNIWQWGRFDDDRRNFREGNWRSLGKDVTWRFVITGSNLLLPYFVLGSFGNALKVMGVATLVNMTIYFFHERIWNFFGFGRTIRENKVNV